MSIFYDEYKFKSYFVLHCQICYMVVNNSVWLFIFTTNLCEVIRIINLVLNYENIFRL